MRPQAPRRGARKGDPLCRSPSVAPAAVNREQLPSNSRRAQHDFRPRPPYCETISRCRPGQQGNESGAVITKDPNHASLRRLNGKAPHTRPFDRDKPFPKRLYQLITDVVASTSMIAHCTLQENRTNALFTSLIASMTAYIAASAADDRPPSSYSKLTRDQLPPGVASNERTQLGIFETDS